MATIITNEKEYKKLQDNPQVILKYELIELIKNECGKGATTQAMIDLIEKCPTYSTPNITNSLKRKKGLVKDVVTY